MLRYLIAGFVTLSASIAFAGGEDYQIECSASGHTMRISHLEDTTDTTGHYQFDIENADRVVVNSFNASSVDYFQLLDKLWQNGEIHFSTEGVESVFKIDGSPFVKRNGLLRGVGSTEQAMSCEVKVSLPLVSCLTNVHGDNAIQHALHFRHGTDVGTTTGYYISRVFRIFGSGVSDFETSIIGAFSLNRRLVSEAFEQGQSIEFQYLTGEKVILSEWVSPSEFKGETNISGDVVPVTCQLN